MTRSQRILSLLVAAIAIGFFIAPLALRAGGVRAACCPENRPFAPAPKLSDGWSIFDHTTRYLIDRMPERQKAVHANSWLLTNVFATTPHYGQNGLGGVANDQALPFSGRPDQDKTTLDQIQPASAAGQPKLLGDTAPVVAGKHGWLYLQHDFDHACHLFIPLPRAMAGWLGFMRTLRAAGKRVILVVTPDKSTIYPENVSSSTPDLKCSVPGKRRLWQMLSTPQAKAAGVYPMRAALEAIKARSPVLAYYKRDSHWNPVGALALPETAVPALDPKIRVLPGEIDDPGPEAHPDDLTVLTGNETSEQAPNRVIHRAKGAPVIPGPSLLVGDSFSVAGYPLLAPYFADLQPGNWDQEYSLIDQLKKAKTVVLEVVEWQFDYYPSTYGALNTRFQALVRKALAKP